MPTGIEAGIASFTSQIISMLNILTWVLFIFLNFVLDPQFIFDLDNGSFMAMLNTIWQLSRDLMNVAFALMLVGAAIYTIVTANKEFVTQHAKNFLLAVVLVNFSWFVPQVIIDVSNVAAATIYGIPSLLLDDSSSMKSCKYKSSVKETPQCTLIPNSDPDAKPVYTCSCRVVVNVDMFMSNGELATYESDEMKGKGWTCMGGVLCTQTKAWGANVVAGHSAILNGLIINHAHLQTMALVPPPIDADDIGEMTVFLLVEGIILLIHIALFFPLLAMFVAFLIRIPILWLTMAFMPFVFLSWVIPGNEYTGMTKRIWEEFLKAAFLPAAIAVPLSVGFILVNAGDQLSASPIESIKIRLIDGVSNYWELLWWLMTLGVLWVGTFTVFEKAGGLYAKTAGTIKSYGEAWGKVAIKAPLSIPLPNMAQSPLSFFKNTLNPHVIGGNLEQVGLADTIKKIRDGTIGATVAGIGEDAAKKGEPQLDLIHQDLEKLRAALAVNKADATLTPDQRAAKNQVEFNKFTHFKIDPGNVKGTLDEFMKGVTKAGADAKKASRNFETKRDELEAAL